MRGLETETYGNRSELWENVHINLGERSAFPPFPDLISVSDLALIDKVLKIQNGRHKTHDARDKGRSIFYSYSKRMRGLSMLYLILISDQVGSIFGVAHYSLNYGVVSMAYFQLSSRCLEVWWNTVFSVWDIS